MPAALKTIVSRLDQLLRPGQFTDYGPNGLQVEGKARVERIITGVTACQRLIDRAVRDEADLLLVHHGYFWRGEDPTITGLKRNRVRALLEHGISLVAYHLPLDAHPQLGNNAQLAKRLGLKVTGCFAPHNGEFIGMLGEPEAPMSADGMAELLARKLRREPLLVRGGPARIRSVAWCTGAAQDYIEQAVQAGADAYITGEVSERTVHIARESGIHFFAAGHHATERYGVQAIGRLLAREFGLRHKFVDIDNPV